MRTTYDCDTLDRNEVVIGNQTFLLKRVVTFDFGHREIRIWLTACSNCERPLEVASQTGNTYIRHICAECADEIQKVQAEMEQARQAEKNAERERNGGFTNAQKAAHKAWGKRFKKRSR